MVAACKGPPTFGAETYARRNVAERGVKRLEQGCAVAARYEKRAANYRAMVVIAALVIRPTSYESPEAGPTRIASGTETSPHGGCVHPSRECRVSGSIDETPDEKGWARVRVLVAYEEAYRSYQDAIVRAIKDRRPHFVVLEATLRELEAALERFGPDVVVCSRPSAEYSSGGKGAWVELPTEPPQCGDICIGGDHEGAVNLGLKRLLSVLDEAEERLQRGTLAESC